MPLITITQADLMKTKVLDNGVYTALIVKVYPLAQSKDGRSINQQIDFEVQNANGKQISYYFNSQLWGKLANLVEAVENTKFEPSSYDTDRLQGKKVDLRLGTQIYNGNPMNEILDFYPAGQGQLANKVAF